MPGIFRTVDVLSSNLSRPIYNSNTVDDDNKNSRGNNQFYTYKNDNIGIKFTSKEEFYKWVDTKQYSSGHDYRQKKYYTKYFEEKRFNSPLELHKHILDKGQNINNIIKFVRGYLNFCEQCDKIPIEVITKYRAILKLKRTRTDFRVPSNEEIVKGYNLVKNNPTLELVFLVQATSGIRYIECLEFLKNHDISKFSVHSNYVSYNVSNLRHTKNINNIYLPISVYKKLKNIDGNYHYLKTVLRKTGCTFSWKYLRKWHYNFMIYNNVPESVADFMQGRANKSISSNHYLARSQQADYWYEKIVERLDKLLNNRR